MITISQLTLEYGHRSLFSNVTLAIDPEWKSGLVGRNGAGKSTLLKLISGEIQPDSGSINRPNTLTLGYLSQDFVITSERTIFHEVLCSRLNPKILDLFWPLHQKMETGEPLTNDEALCYAEAQSELTEEGYYEYTQKAAAILHGLGFSEAQTLKSVSTLSVGWKMRVVLAKLLIKEADFYLFDEPTNHLDISAKSWFCDFLKNAPFGYLLVSHDRYLLDQVCSKTIEVESGRLTLFHSNFSNYVEQRDILHENLSQKAKILEREKERKLATANRFRAAASKAKMAQRLLREVEKMEEIEIPPALPTVSFKFTAPERSGRFPLIVRELSASYSKTILFSNTSFTISRGEKVALIAPNGVGKSTLCSILMNKIQPHSGSFEWGDNVSIGYFEQDQVRALDKKKNIFEHVSLNSGRADEQKIRTMLGSFLFSGDDIYKKIGVLSGGERNRVAMVQLLLQNPNFLILDEPTNHIDLYAKEVLCRALQSYQGSLLLVSHDQDIVNRVSSRVLEITPKGINQFGSYESFEIHNHPQKENIKNTPSNSASSRTKNNSVESRKQLSLCERKIEKLETTKAQLEKQLSSHEYRDPQYQVLLSKLESCSKDLDEQIALWEKLVD